MEIHKERENIETKDGVRGWKQREVERREKHAVGKRRRKAEKRRREGRRGREERGGSDRHRTAAGTRGGAAGARERGRGRGRRRRPFPRVPETEVPGGARRFPLSARAVSGSLCAPRASRVERSPAKPSSRATAPPTPARGGAAPAPCPPRAGAGGEERGAPRPGRGDGAEGGARPAERAGGGEPAQKRRAGALHTMASLRARRALPGRPAPRASALTPGQRGAVVDRDPDLLHPALSQLQGHLPSRGSAALRPFRRIQTRGGERPGDPETKGGEGACAKARLFGNVLCAKSRALAWGARLPKRCERDAGLGRHPRLLRGADAPSAVTAAVLLRRLEPVRSSPAGLLSGSAGRPAHRPSF